MRNACLHAFGRNRPSPGLKSISFHCAPRTSPDRQAVKIVNSRASAAIKSTLRSSAMKAGTRRRAWQHGARDQALSAWTRAIQDGRAIAPDFRHRQGGQARFRSKRNVLHQLFPIRVPSRREPRNIGAMLGPQKDRHQAKRDGGAGLAHGRKNDGCQCARGKSGGRGIAGKEGHRQPDDGEGETRRPGGGEKAAEKSRDPLAAPKPNPDGKQIAEKRPERGKQHGSTRREMGDGQNRDRSLQKIKQKGQRRQILAAVAQNIGRADIAGADRAEVRGSGKTSKDEPERDRAGKIAEEKGENTLKHGGTILTGAYGAT